MHSRWADEDGYQQQHPPEEGYRGEQDGEVAQESHAPEVIWGYLTIISNPNFGGIDASGTAALEAAKDGRDLQLDHQD